MGLDITAYEHVSLTRPHAHGDECYEKGHIFSYASHLADFPLSARGLLANRCYKTTGSAFGFRAGSYSGYNAWREDLSNLALGVSARAVWRHPGEYVSQPFFELINFTDCDGIISQEVCADLAHDFVSMRDEILTDGEEWFVNLYDTWAQAFEIASGRGFVVFH